MSAPTTPAEKAELLESLIRHAMHEHASIEPRGFDSAKRRDQIHDEIDRLLDAWTYLVEVADLQRI